MAISTAARTHLTVGKLLGASRVITAKTPAAVGPAPVTPDQIVLGRHQAFPELARAQRFIAGANVRWRPTTWLITTSERVESSEPLTATLGLIDIQVQAYDTIRVSESLTVRLAGAFVVHAQALTGAITDRAMIERLPGAWLEYTVQAAVRDQVNKLYETQRATQEALWLLGLRE